MRLTDHIIAVVFIIAFTLTMAWPRSTAFAADPAFEVSPGERQLFLDDVADSQSGLRRMLHQPVSFGPVLRPDRSRGERGVQAALQRAYRLMIPSGE